MYEQYALLDAQIKDLTNKKNELKVEILQDMIARGVESEKNTLGKFTISLLKKWEYTDNVKELNEQYKTAKAREESTGDATYVEEESLRFTPSKI